MMLGNAFLIVLGYFLVAHSTPCSSEESIKGYHGYQVVRTQAVTEEHLSLLKKLDDEGTYDFWMGPFKLLGSYSDIMVSPEGKKQLLTTLQNAGMEPTIMVHDVEILAEQQGAETRQSGNMTWTAYHRMAVIYNWLEWLAAENPNLVTVETIGLSTEGRELKVLKISTGGTGKPAFWIDATIHAREWISPAVATYAINELINNLNNVELRNSIDFYFQPMINPDGYEFTHTNDRMWRKSRSTNAGSTCRGTDVNRNFGFKWGFDDNGSSANPCSETHRGRAAYSEPEADAVKNYIMNRANTTNWTAFITLHSYSQLWMSPYGYSETELPADLAELVNVSNTCVSALTALYGTRYQTGAASQILYVSNGSSRDWAKGGDAGFKWVYTIELRDTGTYGFILPANQILPTAIETWAGIRVLAQRISAQSNQ